MKAPKVQPRQIPKERPGPEGGRRDRNRREKVQQLSDSALALFLERGIGAVTIAEIAKKAGMAKGSFYRYAEDKSDLVDLILRPLFEQLDDRVEQTRDALAGASTQAQVTAAYQMLADQLIALVAEMPGAVRLYLQESRAPALGPREPIGRLGARITEHAIALTHFAQEHDLLRQVRADIAALTVVGAIEKHLFELFSGRNLGSPAESARVLVSIIMDGVGQRDDDA